MRHQLLSSSSLLPSQLTEIHELLLDGGQVSPENLLQKIQNCRLIAIATESDQIISVVAIKQPSEEYRTYIKEKAQISNDHQIPELEIGYAYTRPEHRGKGLNRQLTTQLLSQIKDQKIFATTGHDYLKQALQQAGFTQIGKNYQGKYNPDISYFEK